MPDTPAGSSDENGWNGDGDRPSRNNVYQIRSRLDAIAKGQDEARGELGKLKDTFGKAMEGATERGYVIRRIDDRLNDLLTRFAVVESNYVKASQHEKELAPFRKYGSLIATLVISGVVTAGLTMLFKGGH